MVRIRGASTEDVEAIRRLYDAAEQQVYAAHLPADIIRRALAEYNSPAAIRSRILRPERTDGWLVAEDEDTTFAGVGDSVVTGPGEGQITGLCVEPTRRLRGVGAALLAALTERQRGQGMREQWVVVHLDTSDEVPFYTANGFVMPPEGQPFGEAVEVGADGETNIVMHLTMVLRRPMPD